MSEFRPALWRACGMLAVLAAISCSDATGPGQIAVLGKPDESAPVRYPLQAVNGWPLPYVVGLTESGQLDVVAGWIELTERTSRFEQRTLWRGWEPDGFWEDILVVTGRFRRLANGFEVTTDDGRLLWFEAAGSGFLYHEGYLSYAYWR